ncbi:MAG: stage III sporulation protein AG [Lachnospiraceae bacterium]|nr:stage III sporulation protein AG [Lachnospiraceae bacterium]
MEQMKKMMDKMLKGRKMRKDQLLLMILSGILLCVIALPVKETDSGTSGIKSNISNSNYDTVDNHKQTSSETDEMESLSSSIEGDSYTVYWEDKLQEALSQIEGAGEVEVLITLKESETKVLEKDIPEEISETQENDAEGGNRTITEKRMEETTIYTVNEDGQNVPYVSKIIQPVVEGVVVIAQGGDSMIVKQNIIETIQVLFGVDTNKIRVVKMKTKNE